MSRRRRRRGGLLTSANVLPKTVTDLAKGISGVVFQILQKSTHVILTVTGLEKEEAVSEICSTVYLICSSLGVIEYTDDVLRLKTDSAKQLLCQLFDVSPKSLSPSLGPGMSVDILFAKGRQKNHIPLNRINERRTPEVVDISLSLPSTRNPSIDFLDDEAQEAEFVEVDRTSLEEMMRESTLEHGVIFKDIAETYPSDGDVFCRFVHRTWARQEGDLVGVFPVGRYEMTESLVLKPASSAVIETSGDCRIVFPASLFAGKNVEDEFLQFCYVSGSNLKGASTPFKIFKPKEEDLLEVDNGDDGDFVVLKSKDARYQEELDRLRTEKGHAISERDQAMNELKMVSAIIQEKDKHLESLREEMRAIKDQMDKFQENAAVKRETYNQMLEAKDMEMNQVSEQLNQLKLEYEQSVKTLTRAQEDNDDLRVQLQDEKSNSIAVTSALQAEQTTLKSHLEAATKTIESLSSALEKISMERDSDKQKVRDLDKKVTDLTLRLKAAAEEYEKKGKECLKLEAKYSRLQEKINTFMETARKPSRSVSASEASSSTQAKKVVNAAMVSNLEELVLPESAAPSLVGRQVSDASTQEDGAVSGFEDVVSLPCSLCGDVILCSVKNLSQMTTHLETVHNQRVCPVCSQLFDATMEGIDDYLAMHVENHFCVTRFPSSD